MNIKLSTLSVAFLLLGFTASCAKPYPVTFFDSNSPKRPRFKIYHHESAQAKGKLIPVVLEEGIKVLALEVAYESGVSWGVNIGLDSSYPETSKGSVYLKDAKFIVVKANVQAGTKWIINIDEAGVGHTKQVQRRGERGSDGERWESPVQTGYGKWHEYKIPLSDFQAATNKDGWQNIDGNLQRDFQAVNGLHINISGSQGSGRFILHSAVFEKN